MLALDRPLGVVGDLVVYEDHADPERFWYLPTRPRVAAAGDGVPEMSLVKFRGEDASEGATGFFSFVSELRATEDELEAVREKLLEEREIEQPTLSPVAWTGGKAFLAAALEEGDGLVEKMFGEVTPDLAATNRALFSTRLTGEGIELVEAMLDDDRVSPLGVRYELEYVGLRPAFDVRLHADYSRIYEEMGHAFEIGVAYEGVGVRAGIDVATKSLVEQGAIRVEVLHFTDDADLQARVDAAVRWFQDRILDEFFQSRMNRPGRTNLLERAIQAATQLGAESLQSAMENEGIASRLVEALGVSPEVLGALAGNVADEVGATDAQSTFALKLQYSFRDIEEEELRTITLDWSEARAERRTAAPQGLLQQMGPAPEVLDASMEGVFDRLLVNVRPLGDFEELGVERMVVELAYPEEEDPDATRDALVFEPGASDPERFAAWTEGRGAAYRSRTKVHFDTDGPWPGPPISRSLWQTRSSLELAVHPLADVPRIDLEIAAGTLDFAESPEVVVEMAGEGLPTTTLRLSEESPSVRYRRRLADVEADVADIVEEPAAGSPDVSSPDDTDATGVDPEDAPLRGRVRWFLAGGQTVQGPWEAIAGTTWLVGRPWRSRRSVRLFPLLPDDVMEAVVTLTMLDDGVSRVAEERFGPGDRRVRTVEIPSAQEVPPPVRVDVLVIRGDGSFFSGEPFETSDPVVTVSDREGTHRRVGVRLAAGEGLASHGLMAVLVELLDADDEAVDDVAFTESDTEPKMLLVPLSEEGPAPTRYRVTRYRLDGSALVGSVEESTRSELLITAVAPA